MERTLQIQTWPMHTRSGWFTARASFNLNCMSGIMTVNGNSEVTAVRGLLEALAVKAATLENELFEEVSEGPKDCPRLG